MVAGPPPAALDDALSGDTADQSADAPGNNTRTITMDSGDTLVGVTGHHYATPLAGNSVPEPNTLTLFGAPLLAFGMLRLGRKACRHRAAIGASA